MSDSKKQALQFDRDNPAWRHKLWVRLETPEGVRLFINWSRVIKVALVLAVAGWLGLAGALWAFVKYQRGVASVSFVDVAFLPLRFQHYRQNMSRHYLALGQKQLAEGAWTRAIFSLRQAVGKDAHNTDARLTLAGIFQQVQRPDLALSILEDGLTDGRQNPDYIQTLFGLLRRENKLNRLVELGRQLLPARSDAIPVHRRIARLVADAEIDRKNHAAAKTLVTTWFPPDSIEGAMLLARIDEETGYPELAAMQLENLGRSHPANERIGLQLIRLYQRTGQLHDARRVAALRMLQHPNSPGAACDMISLLFETGATDAAQRELDGYFARFGTDQRALMLIASSAMRLKSPDLARQVRQHAPRDDFGRVALPFLFAEITTECAAGDFRSALQAAGEVDQYEHLGPVAQGSLYLMRCWAHYGLGQQGDGESWLNQFLNLSYPTVSSDGLSLAEHLAELKFPAPARRIMQVLLDRNPDDRPALFALVRHDVDQQAWAEVSRRLPQLLALDPAPTALLQSIWQGGRENLTLTPELRQQLLSRLR